MSPPRRLAVLRSHLQPPAASAPAGGGNRDVARGEQAAGISTSPCASAAAAAVGKGGGRGGAEAGGREAEGKGTCVFCRIIRGEAPAFKVYEDDAFLDYSKMSFSFTGSNTTTYSFNMVVNNGAAAGQTHFHIIPRRSGDKLWPTESLRRRSIEPNETSGLVSCIKEQLYPSPEGFKTKPTSSLPKER
uniref:HIT domain-containing protein n=1 Tax=Leersia perrieri TaxID=77586 RepID=A0A0D9XRH1_9ORYZ